MPIENNSPVIKVANVEDEATGDAFELFSFRKVGGRVGEAQIERDKASDWKAVAKLLTLKNATADAVKEGAIKKAIAAKPREKRLHVERLGWRKDHRTFVTMNGTIGKQPVRKLYSPISRNKCQHLYIEESGSLRAWRLEVAFPCLRSDIALLALSSSFAAPLLKFVGMQTFGINIFGDGKVGKTAALLAATSVYGTGVESKLSNFASTAGARDENAPLFNDLLYPANEVGLLAGKRKDAYAPIREFVYTISEGRVKARHSISSYATPASSAEYRTIFIATAEHSFAWYAKAAGDERDDGEIARCLDVPAAPGSGNIMNRPVRGLSKARTRSWSRKVVIELRHACERNHGVSFKPYIEYLMSRNADLASAIGGYMEDFLASTNTQRRGPAIEHAAKNFALIYAGGRLAMDARVLPRRPNNLKRAIVACFNRALAELGEKRSPDELAVEILREKLGGAGLVERVKSSDFGEKDHVGYYKYAGDHRVYVIHAKAFRSWFSDDRLVMYAALAWLRTNSLLTPKATQKQLSKDSCDWAVSTPKWPNGKGVRSIVFRDPFANNSAA